MKFDKYISYLLEEKETESKKTYKNVPGSRIEVLKRLDSVFGSAWRKDKEYDGLRRAFRVSVKNANQTIADYGFNNENNADWEKIFVRTLEGTTTSNEYGSSTIEMLARIGIVG